MFNRRHFNINDKGHLVFNGCDTVELAQRYGTPLYVISEDIIREKCSEIKGSFKEKYPNTEALYASKAFITIAMCKIIAEEGLGLDVVSSGELFIAIQAGFPADRIYFHGNNKTYEEIEYAVQNNIGCFVIDNFYEMELIAEVAGKFNKKADALLRISPGIKAHTHAYITTGQLDSKFGFPILGDVAMDAVKRIMTYSNINFKGIHCHIGSQIFNPESYRQSAAIMSDLAIRINRELGTEVEILNLGGGFGIYYTKDDEPKPLQDYTDAIMEVVIGKFESAGIKLPKVIIEPGRWVVGEAGITLYTLGAMKEIKGVRTYVSIDGGMTDNPRPAMYKANYEAVIANKALEEKTDRVSIAGKCCESGDMLIWDLMVPKVVPGDILAVFSTGAYNYSMASNYNRLRRPAVVMVSKGASRLIVKRESYSDLLRNEIVS